MIRKASLKDIELLNNLGKLVNDNFTKVYNLESYLQDEKYLIIVNEDNFVNGFLLVLKNIDCYEIEMIVVDLNYRHQGIGSNLLTYFIDNYLELDDKVFLEVAVNNLNALKLYQKMGFSIINTRKKYYNGVDAYVMKR